MGDSIRIMGGPRVLFCSALAVGLAIGCESDSTDETLSSLDSGISSSTGGTIGAGARSNASGGAITTSSGGARQSGGATGAGGNTTSSGGTSGSDASAGSGGRDGSLPGSGGVQTDASTNGGAQSSGGAVNSGGAPNTGGVTATGGVQNTGGAVSTGGVQNTGGAVSTGGAQNTGGAVNTGGAQNTGGVAATGGAQNTGGASTGGSCTCSTGGVTGTGGSGGTTGPTEGGCPIFTSDDAWNRDISGDGVDSYWTGKLVANATLTKLHPDFGNGFGIPYNVVPQNQTKLAITFDYGSESDPSPYPFPGSTAKIEGGTPTSCGGDCHVLALQQGVCLIYEGYACSFTTSSSSWHCGSGAKFDLTKNSYGQRPIGWTSADAAGLSIFAGLARYDEVAAGAINHAIRFTMHCTQDGFVNPASHQAVPTGTNGCPMGIQTSVLEAEYPPMGLRIRLKSTYDISAMPAQAKIVAQAMKTYGMILADNGSDYFFQGDDNPGWSNTQLNALKNIPADQFEAMMPGTISR